MPDLNSVPPSPHVLASSRRQSTHNLAADGPPSPSLNILPSNQSAVAQASATDLSPLPPPLQPQSVPQEETPVGAGPGPIRHPQPLTASELHTQLEKEQEALVNRLTRELSILRQAQNASVVSNASSNSATASAHEATPDASLLSGSGFTIPAARRHNRTSSSASQQFGTSHDGRPTSRQPPHGSISRQNSSASHRSQAHSPAPQTSLDPLNYFQQQRMPSLSAVPTAGSMEPTSPGLIPATLRYEETALHRNELDSAKRENETLKMRIRELEKQLHEKRDTSRTRSASQSTTASASIPASGGTSIAGPREATTTRAERRLTAQSVTSIAVGVPDDELQVGESAATTTRANDHAS